MAPRHRKPRSSPSFAYGRSRTPARLTAGVAAATVAAAVGASVGLTASPAPAAPAARLDAATASSRNQGTVSLDDIRSALAPSWQTPTSSPLAGQSAQASGSPLASQSAPTSSSPLAVASEPSTRPAVLKPRQDTTQPSRSSTPASTPSSPAPAPSHSPAAGNSGQPTTPFEIYDSVTPGAIPAGYQIATYATGKFTVPASEVSDPGHVLWIDTQGTDPGADALDVEPGDATPAMAATWVQQKLDATPNAVAIVYTMESEWPSVQAAVSALPSWMQSHIRWWIADPTGVPHIVPGSSATQWYWGPSYDISTALPNFEQLSTPTTTGSAATTSPNSGQHSTGSASTTTGSTGHGS